MSGISIFRQRTRESLRLAGTEPSDGLLVNSDAATIDEIALADLRYHKF